MTVPYDDDPGFRRWRDVAADNGVLSLYDHFVRSVRKAGLDVQYNKGKSVVARVGNVNLLSVHPKDSRAPSGLWLGYSRTNFEKRFGRNLPPSALPSGFEDKSVVQKGNEWRFGFFRDEGQISKIAEAIADLSRGQDGTVRPVSGTVPPPDSSGQLTRTFALPDDAMVEPAISRRGSVIPLERGGSYSVVDPPHLASNSTPPGRSRGLSVTVIALGLLACVTIAWFSLPWLGGSRLPGRPHDPLPFVALPPSVTAGSAVKAQGWALVVGIDRYDSDGITPLKDAGADAISVGKALVEVCGFPAGHVLLMTSGSTGRDRPTFANILQRLAGLQHVMRRGDSFVFFFSGHGIQDSQKQSYLLAADTIVTSEALLHKTSLAVRDVRDAIGALPATRILQIVDACRNDPLGGSRSVGDNLLTRGFAKDLALVRPADAESTPGLVVTLYACQPGQRSYEGYRGHGYFSFFLDQGLRGAAARPDGVVTLNSLEAYLERTVPDQVSLGEGGRVQVPYEMVEGTGVARWVLAHVQRPAGPMGDRRRK